MWDTHNEKKNIRKLFKSGNFIFSNIAVLAQPLMKKDNKNKEGALLTKNMHVSGAYKLYTKL